MILLIDDDDGFRLALAAILQDDGFEVRDYAAAIDVPSPNSLGSVEAVITDYDMVGMDGISFADSFHKACPGVPILMVSAFSTRYLMEQVAQRSFMRLFRKPLDYEALLSVLRPTHGGGSTQP